MSKVRDLINKFDKNKNRAESPITTEKEISKLKKRKMKKKTSVREKIALFEKMGGKKWKKKKNKTEEKVLRK